MSKCLISTNHMKSSISGKTKMAKCGCKQIIGFPKTPANCCAIQHCIFCKHGCRKLGCIKIEINEEITLKTRKSVWAEIKNGTKRMGRVARMGRMGNKEWNKNLKSQK